MTKTQFKKMIKECILEMIQDGQLNEIAAASSSKPAYNHAQQSVSPYGSLVEKESLRSTIKQSFLEGDSGNFTTGEGHTYSLNSSGPSFGAPQKTLIENLALGMAKGNASHAATYAAIFADTAMHTVPQQAALGDTQGAAGFMTNGSGIESVTYDGLQKLAGGDMSKWATVAFGGKKGR